MAWSMFSRFGDFSNSDIVSFAELEDAIGTNLDGGGRSRAARIRRWPHSERSQHSDVWFRSQGAAAGKAGGSHLSVRRTVAQCAAQGAGDWPREREALSRRD
jgi:hypothetical protein